MWWQTTKKVVVETKDEQMRQSTSRLRVISADRNSPCRHIDACFGPFYGSGLAGMTRCGAFRRSLIRKPDSASNVIKQATTVVRNAYPPFLCPTMILSRLAPLALLPFAAAGGVHKLKLKKLPQELPHNPALESAYLAEKYGGGQTPLFGAGGVGRSVRLSRPGEDDSLYWTQDSLKGGHNVPLSSGCHHIACRSTYR